MKYSIKKQFALIFIGLMSGTIVIFWIVNNTFLESYYIKNKTNTIKAAYNNVNNAVNSGDINSEDFDIELRKNCDMYNMNIVVIDASSKTIKSSSRDTSMLVGRLYELFFNPVIKNKISYVEESENYYIAMTMDKAADSEYLEMWGAMDNGNLFLIRTPLESIRESASIANRFLAYVGIFTTIVSAVIIWMVTSKITKPIRQLCEISTKMANLDFEKKYISNGKNEIDLLGEHINTLSYTLEKTISELKTANNELQRDIEKKEEIDEMRKEFLSNVSHELKTPIALIQGYAEGLKEGIIQDEESRDYYLDVIMDESSKMNNMVKKLLDLNNLESGKDVVTMERFDIVSLVHNFLNSADIIIRQNNVTVRHDANEPIYVWADEFKTEEVIRNYFSNAINHVNGEKIIEIKYNIIEENRLRVSVFNTGEPIPEESVSRIWEKFYKVDKARTREYGGSGVGLSIVKAIMESMNQKYGVINYTNGVEFWFELETK